MIAATQRLRKHADYQHVYKSSRKQFAKQMGYFALLRETCPEDEARNGPRIGLTVPKALGNAVVRNRIKRRMREVVRRQLKFLDAPVDVVLHPRRTVIDSEFAALEREVSSVFRAIQKAMTRTPTVAAGSAVRISQ
jgi:ribonuclease P protein component